MIQNDYLLRKWDWGMMTRVFLYLLRQWPYGSIGIVIIYEEVGQGGAMTGMWRSASLVAKYSMVLADETRVFNLLVLNVGNEGMIHNNYE